MKLTDKARALVKTHAHQRKQKAFVAIAAELGCQADA
jgi:hypothetical protein